MPLATWYKSEGDTEMQYYRNGLIINDNINVKDMVDTYSSWRMTYKSQTTSLNATNFNNQGVVTSCQFRPNVSRISLAALIERSGRSEEVIKAIYHAYEGRSETSVSLKEMVKKLSDGSALQDTTQLVDLGVIPATATQVEMISPMAASTTAKEGAFMINSFSQPIAEYKSVTYSGVKSETPVIPPCFYFFKTNAGAYGYKPFTQPDIIPGSIGEVVQDITWSDMTWGWIMYSGLTEAAVTSGVGYPYITIKPITGAELQPKPGSVVAPYSHASAMPDQKAIEIAALSAYGRMDALPARYNFLGSIFPLMLKAAPAVIGALVNAFGTKTTVKKDNDRAEQILGTANRLLSSVKADKLSKAKETKEPATPSTTVAVKLATKKIRKRKAKAKT